MALTAIPAEVLDCRRWRLFGARYWCGLGVWRVGVVWVLLLVPWGTSRRHGGLRPRR